MEFPSRRDVRGIDTETTKGRGLRQDNDKGRRAEMGRPVSLSLSQSICVTVRPCVQLTVAQMFLLRKPIISSLSFSPRACTCPEMGVGFGIARNRSGFLAHVHANICVVVRSFELCI